MVLFNYSTRELTAKIVYYGPGLCGKTTNLQYIYDNLPGKTRGKMLSLATKTDRTLFFDFLPIDLGEIRGMKTRIQLYTVPGQVFYNETRRLVLKGADGVVFVADSQKQMLDANLDSFRNLEENLKAHGLKLSEVPLVVQFNKRDLPNVASIEELSTALNRHNAPFYESVATTGIGVQDTLKAITKLVLVHLTKKYDVRRPASGESAAVAAPAPAAVPSTPPAAAAASAKAAEKGKKARRRSEKPAAAAGKRGPAVKQPAASPPVPVSPAAMPVAASVPSAAVAAGVEEVVDLVDVVEEAPAASFQEVTDERELFSREQSAQIDSLGASVEISAAPGDSSVEIPVEEAPGVPSATIAEVDEQAELFSEETPIARVDPARPTEVVIPVEVKAGEKTRRYRLTVRLSVDDLEKLDR